MSKRVCAEPGCGQLIDKAGRCTTHEREADKARGTTTQRGYGHEHQQLRKHWANLVATGTVDCCRCGETIQPDQPWALDHDDDDRTKYLGASHRACNDAAGGRARHR